MSPWVAVFLYLAGFVPMAALERKLDEEARARGAGPGLFPRASLVIGWPVVAAWIVISVVWDVAGAPLRRWLGRLGYR